VLVVDKPAGPTSFDVVARVKRALRLRKAGHAGTLDPSATGVLVVCLEDAVRLQQFLAEGDKSYEATVVFGAATRTEDGEGEVVVRADATALSEEALRAVLPSLTGEIFQLPPMFSAVRVGGRRLFEAARAGEVVARSPRKVRVDSLELLELGPSAEGCRQARLAVSCGKGTYVRTLASDLGRRLGLPAHLAALRRTRSSGFELREAVGLESLEALVREGGPEAARRLLVPPAAALRALPEARISPHEAADLSFGRSVAALGYESGLFRAVDEAGRLVAVCRASEGWLRPVRVFLSAAELGR